MLSCEVGPWQQALAPVNI